MLTWAWPWRGKTAERDEAKASATGPLIAYQSIGQPVWAPRDYAAFAREGFMQNAIVYRSVRMIAEAAASIPLLLYEGEAEIDEHPLLSLLARPSSDQTGTDFLEAWYGFLLVAGNAYVEAVALDGALRELHVLRPDRMTVVPGPDGWPEAFDYSAGGRSIRFEDEPLAGVRPILHVRLFHPANDHYGMSPIEAAATAIDVHNTASGWNKALLDNSARPSGALVYASQNGQMTAAQFARLKGELETTYQGAKHAGRPLLLEGGLDWKPLSLSPKDMDFIEAKNGAAREIALAIGVPPMLLGIPGDNTYSNYQEAQRAFWRQTVLPLVNRTARAVSAWLAPAFGGGLALRPDLDQVEALSGEREALWRRLQGVSFLTDDEKRAAIGYGPKGEGFAPGDLAVVPGLAVPEDALALLEKYSPDQPRVPAGSSDGGQWTDTGGSGGRGGGGRSAKPNTDNLPSLSDNREDDVPQVQLVNRRLTRTVTIGNRQYTGFQSDITILEESASRAEGALRTVRTLDPEWRPIPSLTSPDGVQGAIGAYRSLAQQAEARALVIERGGVPLGFSRREEFIEFGRNVRIGTTAIGATDAEPYLRGSAVAGYNYRTGEAFDVGRRSDYDLAIASPILMQRARELGVRMRESGARTHSLKELEVRQLGLEPLIRNLSEKSRRSVTIMIYQNKRSLEGRGPFLTVP